MSCLVERRVLDGANVYFTRPAVKLTLDATSLLEVDADAAKALATASRLGASGPGVAGSEQRRRFALRLLTHLTRRLAAEAGVQRLSVRARAGDGPHELVVAYPWSHRGRAEALADAIVALLDDLDAGSVEQRIAELGSRVAGAPLGDPPRVPRPRIPVVAVTGTNGKTTTSRLIAHLAAAAGHRPGWSSTDGVYRDGELVEAGDWSGFGGAGQVLSDPRTTFAVLETARGGILLRGIGARHNDVAVVTNIQADHLGLHGIHTLDQLAEVKASIVRITRPEGWAVLNADDPRVLAMRRLTKAQIFAYSLDPDSPGLREVVDGGGRGTTLLDGDIVLVDRHRDPDHVIPVVDVPLTLAGLSTHNVANTLAAVAAAIAIGLPRAAIVAGLRDFRSDATLNPGRMNLFGLDDRVLVVDSAHNEDSLRALLHVCRGLCAPAATVHLVLGGVGDRPDEAIRALGEIAGRGADHVVIGHKEHYLRGRTTDELTELLTAGLEDIGRTAEAVYDTELEGLQAVFAASGPGDVCAVMCHAERREIYAWLDERGAVPLDDDAVRALVLASTPNG